MAEREASLPRPFHSWEQSLYLFYDMAPFGEAPRTSMQCGSTIASFVGAIGRRVCLAFTFMVEEGALRQSGT